MRTFSGKKPTETGVMPATRMRRVRWRDARMWLGLGLIVVSMVAGARLLSASEDRAVVWRATRDLAPGATAVAEPVSVVLDAAQDAYASGSQPLVGRMRVPVAAGALIPRDAVVDGAVGDVRDVTVPIDPLHAPVALAAGDVVDVWATPTDAGGHALAPLLVLSNVLVADVATDAIGVGGEMPVVVELAAADVTTLVSAMRTGAIDLVRVPLDAVTS